MIKNKPLVTLLLALTLSLTVAACGSSTDTDTNPNHLPSENKSANEPTTLVYGSGDYTSINPALYEHGEINSLLFLGLTTHDKNNNVIPGLASEWEWDAALKTYTFTLRDGITFHDGKPVTSADVKFTFEAIQNEANGSENASNYEDIIAIETPDDKTVIFTLSTPNTAMPDYLSMGILPKHLLAGKNITEDPFNQNPIGAGPYQLVSWDIGQTITMKKFEHFCLGTPKIDQIIFKIVKDYNARALQLTSGELDLAQVTPKDAEPFKSNSDFDIYQMDTADYRGILYNFGHAFWQEHPGLPAALSYAIDRDAIIETVLLGQGQAAYTPLQKNKYHNPDVEHYDYNPNKAKKEIEALGFTMGGDGFYEKNGKPLAFAISAPSSDQVRVDMANICAQNLQDIGVNATVELPAQTDWTKQYAYLIGWGSPFDPDDHTYKVFGTDKGANFSSYSNRRVDDLLAQARTFTNENDRLPLYKEFQTELAKDPAYTFIAYLDAIYIAKKGIRGITPDTVLGHHGVGIFWNVWEWNR
jgi:peptide/nickel transport system substrate-binding protein